MLHSKHITLSAGGSESSSSKSSFLANQGVIYHVWITFPPGSCGLVKVRLFHEGHPFLPVDADAYVRGDNYTFNYPMFYEITDAPERITIEAWNEDDTYDHTIDVQMLIIQKEWIMPIGAYEGIIAALRSVFRR